MWARKETAKGIFISKKLSHYKPKMNIKIHINLYADSKFPSFFQGCPNMIK